MIPGAFDSHKVYWDLYRQEVLRWNASMNLLSRRDPEKALTGLMEQCWSAMDLLWAWLAEASLLDPESPVRYIDLGAGAGLPGVIWTRFLATEAGRVDSTLVEPREKRAWFLRRVADLDGGPPFGVIRSRWGGEMAEARIDPAPPLILISLKALLLSDFQVVSGLRGWLGQGSNLAGGLTRVVIARFYPPDQKLNPELDDSLAGSEGPGDFVLGNIQAKYCGRDILGPTKGLLPACLVITRFDLIPR
ncbi:hypothetical protein GW813_03850 [bacterium]|nr:hypothetical protein [bacterium]PIV80351.1 MAG: hypothetical protein COW53_10175 [bacterium CG17_big_fil_post_rev_8_21_14_2_50_64_8]PJA75829.1 MAG: hypothetical protein CO151_04700 [bacterium CG_4_9_14_3_um_filter_65_15]